MENRKPRIGLLTLMYELYDAIPSLEPEMREFGQELVNVIEGMADVNWPGICKTRREVDDAVKVFEGEEADLIIVVLLTYAPSHVALQALVGTKLPILILNTQGLSEVRADMDPEDLIRNHGMHGVQDLANVLLRASRDFELITGHYRDEGLLTELGEWCRAASAASLLRRSRIGAMGHPLQGMGDFALDETQLLGKLGVDVHHISQADLARLARKAPEEVIRTQMEEDRRTFKIAPDVSEREHEEGSRLEWAIREVLQREKLDAFTMNFMEVSTEGCLQSLPFLAASKMLAEGYGYAGEGDVLTTLAVAMMHHLAGPANFTEMFTMDFGGNAILMSHMGEGNHLLAREDMPVELVGQDLRLANVPVRPVLLRFALRPRTVTLVNLTVGAGGELKLIVTEGEVLDFPPIEGVMTPHYKFQPERPLAEFLTELSQRGSSHHFALVYGKWASLLEKTAKMLGIGFNRI